MAAHRRARVYEVSICKVRAPVSSQHFLLVPLNLSCASRTKSFIPSNRSPFRHFAQGDNRNKNPRRIYSVVYRELSYFKCRVKIKMVG